MRVKANGGGGGGNGLIITPSSTSASAELSGYGKVNAINLNFASRGWLPNGTDTSANYTVNLGATKDVKYVLFAMTASSYEGSISYTTPITIGISVSTGGSYTQVANETFARQGTSFIYKIYPINKSASSIKIDLTVPSASESLAVGNGYKIAVFE